MLSLIPSDANDPQIDGRRGPGKVKLTWKKLMETTAMSGNSRRLTLKRSGVRSAMCATSQLP